MSTIREANSDAVRILSSLRKGCFSFALWPGLCIRSIVLHLIRYFVYSLSRIFDVSLTYLCNL